MSMHEQLNLAYSFAYEIVILQTDFEELRPKKKNKKFQQTIYKFSQKGKKIVPVFLSNCSPNDITGIADAKNMQVVGAKILKYIYIQNQIIKLKHEQFLPQEQIFQHDFMYINIIEFQTQQFKALPDPSMKATSPVLLVAKKPSSEIIFYSSEWNKCFLHAYLNRKKKDVSKCNFMQY